MKPIAWYDPTNGAVSADKDSPLFTPLGQVLPLYPEGEWVGLTNNELQPIADEYRILFGGWVEDFSRAIEAKLKEKNAPQIDPNKWAFDNGLEST